MKKIDLYVKVFCIHFSRLPHAYELKDHFYYTSDKITFSTRDAEVKVQTKL